MFAGHVVLNLKNSISLVNVVETANYNIIANLAWYINSRATNHVIKNRGILLSYCTYTGNEKLYIGNGMGLSIMYVGTTIMNTLEQLYLSNVLHVPDITKNLLSISRLLVDNHVLF